MKKPLSTRKRIALFSGFLIIVTFLLFIECNLKFPKDITLFKGENLLISSSSPYSLYTPASFGGVLSESGETFEKTSSADKKYVKANDVGEYSASVRLFGVIPIKNVTINVSDTKTLIPCGDTIGIKMFTEGLLCVGVSDIADKNGKIYNIASENDIKPGDIFISANDTALTTTEQFADIVTNSDGNQISLLIERNKKRFKKEISPRLTSDGYKIGIWVRDSTAGIGTLSFVDPITGDYGALGHPICDSDTGILMPVSSGSIVKADVFGVQKGEKGVPGELKGTFDMSLGDIGTIEKNTSCGIYGKINSPNLSPLFKRRYELRSYYISFPFFECSMGFAHTAFHPLF